MTDTQILTLTIAITFPVLGFIGSLAAMQYSNKRVDDLNAFTNQRMDALKADLVAHIDNGFEHMEMLLKLHESEHHRK